MDTTQTLYIAIAIQAALALAIALGIITVSHLFGQRATTNPTKDSPYECGLIARGKAHPRFSVKFYVTAMLFILFDIEIVFLIPWVLVYRDMLAANIPILAPILFFLLVLTIGLAYELKKGAIDWERPQP